MAAIAALAVVVIVLAIVLLSGGGGHKYTFEQTGLDRAEQRDKFAKYLQRYDVAPEE